VRSTRLEALSDGVIAIIITIMVLEFEVPHEASWEALDPLIPKFGVYALSFIYLGIYWNNHHHMLQIVERVNGGVLWANLHLLFWLSLVPFGTAWLGENDFAEVPSATYGTLLLFAAIAYLILQKAILAAHGPDFELRTALGRDMKGKVSPVLYVTGIGLSFVNRWVALGTYVIVALMWLVPDKRIESVYDGKDSQPST
jgi:uncharacterized membrane protein